MPVDDWMSRTVYTLAPGLVDCGYHHTYRNQLTQESMPVVWWTFEGIREWMEVRRSLCTPYGACKPATIARLIKRRSTSFSSGPPSFLFECKNGSKMYFFITWYTHLQLQVSLRVQLSDNFHSKFIGFCRTGFGFPTARIWQWACNSESEQRQQDPWTQTYFPLSHYPDCEVHSAQSECSPGP